MTPTPDIAIAFSPHPAGLRAHVTGVGTMQNTLAYWQAIVARLQACNEIIEARTRQGRGAAINPADQWGHQPGDIGEPNTLH